MDEAQELEFASRLLELSGEQELERLLGDVFRAAGNAIGRLAGPDTGRVLGAILKDAVGRAVPLAAVPGAGMAGPAELGDLAQQAASLLGLELEGLSPPEQEFEMARQVVRLAGHAYRHAAWAPRTVPPRTAARMAAARAARRYAPGLMDWAGRPGPGYGRRGWHGTRHGYAYRPATRAYPQAARYWRPDPWWSRRAYPWPRYAWGYGTLPYDVGDNAAKYGPDGYDGSGPEGYAPDLVAEPPLVAMPTAPVDPVPVPIPPSAAAADPAVPAVDPGSSGEFGPSGPASGGLRRPGSRGGRWERHGSVLIVHGI